MAAELPAIVDLFSGCGGLGWGFKEAGFPLFATVDSDEAALKNYKSNAFAAGHRLLKTICKDACEIESHELSHDSNQRLIVVGGPPCQAYSRIGRGKLRSLGEDRHHLKDQRGRLFEEFVRIASSVDAEAVVMENVLDSINYGGANIPEIVCEMLDKAGYNSGWSILNAANYGVPQSRERIILIGIKRSLECFPTWPTPTHSSGSPTESLLFTKTQRLRAQSKYFVEPPEPNQSNRAWVTVGEALGDLPTLSRFPEEYSARLPINLAIPYSSSANNDFQQLMRRRQRTSNGTTGHIYRDTPRDFPIFSRMGPGQNFPDACDIAENLLSETCVRLGVPQNPEVETYKALRAQIVPPYSRLKFEDKWRRLDPNRPSHTLVAHLGVDAYSHIHPWEPRGISVREAARLQSFPDDFHFNCTMGDAYKQIGNAVPPLVSFAVASELACSLKTTSPCAQ